MRLRDTTDYAKPYVIFTGGKQTAIVGEVNTDDGLNGSPPPRILVVDDNEPTREFLTDLLEMHGYEVRVAAEGTEAMAEAENHRPDLILLDILMPGRDGFDVCRALKARRETADIPVMFMTALRKTDHKVRGLGAGAVDYLIKPLEPAEVLARIRTHLQVSQLRRQLQLQNELLEERVAERTAQLANLNRALRRFVPHEFLAFLDKQSITDVALGDHVRRKMTVMFSDVHGWTQWSEKMTPEQGFRFINDYFKEVSPIIREHSGFVDQYYGDGIMALFDHTPDDAVAAAVAIFHRLDRPEVIASMIAPLEIGIGLHTGTLALGILGENERMQGAVVSDDVNLASRLEGITRMYRARVLLSESTLLGLKQPESWQIRFLGQVRVKGRVQPVGVYEVLDADPAPVRERKLETLTDYQAALRDFRQGDWDAATKAFRAIADYHPEDITVQRHLDRIEEVRQLPEGSWEGVIILTSKI